MMLIITNFGEEALFTKQHVNSMEIIELDNSTINSKTRKIIYNDLLQKKSYYLYSFL